MQQGEKLLAGALILCAALTGCSKLAGDAANTGIQPPAATVGDLDLNVQVGPYKARALQNVTSDIKSGDAYLVGSPESKKYLQVLATHLKRSGPMDDLANIIPQLPDPEAGKRTLVLAFPTKLLGEEFLFGGVATKVSNKEDPNLGSLKLLAMSPIHVRPIVTDLDSDHPQLTLLGCADMCNERSVATSQMNIPILAVDAENDYLLIDLSAIGQKLNLISIFDPDGEETELKPKTSYTSLVDYSAATLVFDVSSDMINVKADIKDPDAVVTKFTFRWYLKPSSGFDSAFESREPVVEAGFFTTERATKRRITRFAVRGNKEDSVHYYVKNVPDEFKEPFKMALDEWNQKMQPVFGRDFLTYEFVDVGDARNPYLIAGDVRFNVIEWDLDNVAPYGGLGPSTANQHTGETFSANVLIQGPTIVKIYKTWFGLSAQAQALRAAGQTKEADTLILNFQRQVEKQSKVGKAHVKLGPHEMKIGALLPPLQDPLAQRGDFDRTPEKETYESYMKGYFAEMLEHEIGHNLGLRHNFRGNLGDDNSMSVGSTSRSVMEYLPRRQRYLDRISPYDVMAMSYGYQGVKPTHSDWFCTDEDVIYGRNARIASPECSRDDATNDPYGYFDGRLTQAIDYLINRGSPQAPVWTLMDMQSQLSQTVLGLGFYASSARNYAKWTNFARDSRPTDEVEIRKFVLMTFKAHLCDASFIKEIEAKESEEAMAKTAENIEFLRTATAGVLAYYGIYRKEEVACE